MDSSSLKSVLIRFAESEQPEAKAFLEAEARKIATTLSTSTNYETIEQYISLLDAFAYRVPEQAFEIVTATLERLETLMLKLPDSPYFSAKEKQAFYSKEKLIVACLDVLNRIRYVESILQNVLLTFLRYHDNAAQPIKDSAQNYLRKIASFNLKFFKRRGLQAQQQIIEIIKQFNSEQLQHYLPALVILCDRMLEPRLEGMESDYQGVSIISAPHHVTEQLKALRQEVILILEQLYRQATTYSQKRSVISALKSGSHLPTSGDYSDELLMLAQENGRHVLAFLEQTAQTEPDLLVVQEIEHEAYWEHRRANDNETKVAACRVKKQLDKNAEYQVFKVLIGFHGVFNTWCDEADVAETVDNEIQLAKKKRDAQLEELLQSVCPETYPQWLERILEWVKIESNDLAMFLYFGDFLGKTAERHPDFALELLKGHDSALERFIIPLMLGLLQSDKKKTAIELHNTWLEENKHLHALARVYEYAQEFDIAFFERLVQAVMTKGDTVVLSQAIAVIAAKFDMGGNTLINTLFADILQKLTEHKFTGWVHEFWFRKETIKISGIMTKKTIDILLKNFVFLPRVDTHAEYILGGIAKRFPLKVIALFHARLKYAKRQPKRSGYDAIPYELHEIPSVFQDEANDVTNAIRKWYDRNYGMFSLQGGRLVKILYPAFPDNLEAALLSLVQRGDDKDFLFVMAVLRNYEGNIRIQNVCVALINALPADSKYLNEIRVILYSTGGVSGEYGFVEAYKAKISQIEPWLKNESPKIQSFAQLCIKDLEAMIVVEQECADERIEIRKYRFGGNSQS